MVCLVRYSICSDWFDLPPENDRSIEWIEIIEECLELMYNGGVVLN
jgi:hypothetical protein